MNLGRQPGTARPLCVCKEVPQCLSSVVVPAIPDVGRQSSVLEAGFPRVGRGRQEKLSEAAELSSGCADKGGPLLWAAGRSTAAGKARCSSGLWVSLRAQLPSSVREQGSALTHSGPLSNGLGLPPPLPCSFSPCSVPLAYFLLLQLPTPLSGVTGPHTRASS